MAKGPLPVFDVALHSMGRSVVRMNGVKLDGVVGITVDAAVDALPKVTITFFAEAVTTTEIR